MNYYVTITCLLALTASIKADPSWGNLVYAPGHASVDYYAYPRYAFEYAVKDPHTGDNKAQWEKRDGDVVKGAYSLVEPDGSIRVVEYWADDKSGFNAVVKRLGPNLHPATIPVAPIYKAPIPVLSEGTLGPLSIGPVGKLGGLAAAPLIAGPVHGGAISSASLYKAPAISTVTPIAPIAPVSYAPIAPASYAPILPSPLAKPFAPAPILSGQIGHAPIWSGPINHGSILSGPIGHGNILSGPIGPAYKSGPILSAPFQTPILSAPLPAIKGPIGLSGLGLWGDGLIKGQLAGPSYLDSLGQGYLTKGPLLPSWGGPLNYPLLGLKH